MMSKSTHKSTHRSWVMIILALVMVSATAQMVSADSQTWFLSSDHTASNHTMYKGSQSGEKDNVTINSGNSVIWVANQSADCDVGFAPGAWNVHLRKLAPTPLHPRSFNVSIGVWNESILNFTSYGYKCGYFPWYDRDVEFDIPASQFDVKQGEYLALRVENTGSNAFAIRTTDQYLVGENGFKSYVKSPCSDPGYPVPELPTLVLVSAGLLMLVGYAYMGRRNK